MKNGGGNNNNNNNKPKKKRCNVCKRKLTISNEYHCICGLWVCLAHRDEDEHDCKKHKQNREKERELLEKKLVKSNVSKNYEKI